jgi:hypothetical protein
MRGNAAYFTARAAEERAFAITTMDPEKRAAHRRLAERYQALATTFRARQSSEAPRANRSPPADPQNIRSRLLVMLCRTRRTIPL